MYEYETKIKGAISRYNLPELESEDKQKFDFIYKYDAKNSVFFNEHGAVYGCVLFRRDTSEEEKQKWFKEMYKKELREHPEYELSLVPGEFPFEYEKGYRTYVTLWSNYVVMIKGYKNILKKQAEEEEEVRKREIDRALKGIKTVNKTFDSPSLPGAVNIDSYFMALQKYFPYDNDFLPDPVELEDGVSSDIIKDRTNNIFVSEKGAVLNAYNLSKLSENDKKSVIEVISNSYKNEYPNYEFTLVEGKFPVDCDDYGEFEYSTHILYLTNYKQCLKQEKGQSFKR